MFDPFSLGNETIDTLLMLGLAMIAITAFVLSHKASHDLSENHWDTNHWPKL